MRRTRLSFAPLVVLALLDCKASEGPALVSVQPPAASAERAPEPVEEALLVAQAPAFVAEGPIETRAAVSECGGFHGQDVFSPEAPQVPTSTLGFMPSPLGRSAQTQPNARIPSGAQQLRWSYERGTLRITNEEVQLNCCGDPLQAELVQGEAGWVMRELELEIPRGDGPGGICGCICSYDFAVEATNVPEGLFPLTVTRELQRPGYDDADLPEGEPVWTGILDLSEGSGSIQVGRIDSCQRVLACLVSGTCPAYAPLSESECASREWVVEAHCKAHDVRYEEGSWTRAVHYWRRDTGALVGVVEWGEVGCEGAHSAAYGEIPVLRDCEAHFDPCRPRAR